MSQLKNPRESEDQKSLNTFLVREAKLQNYLGLRLLAAAGEPQDEGEDEVQELIDLGVDVNYLNLNNFGALHQAASEGNSGSLARLLKAGANPKQLDEGGGSPLHWAAGRLSFQCLAALAQHDLGDAPLRRNMLNLTPMDLAMEKVERTANFMAIENIASTINSHPVIQLLRVITAKAAAQAALEEGCGLAQPRP